MATRNKNTDKIYNDGYYIFGHDLNSTTTGYPKGEPLWKSPTPGRILTPKDHFKPKAGVSLDQRPVVVGSYMFTPKDHFIYDVTNPDASVNKLRHANEADGVYNTDFADTYVAVFSGSSTLVNPFEDAEKEKMMQPNGFRRHDIENSLHHLDASKEGTSERVDAPLHPLQPFMSLHPAIANKAVMNYYNRTKLQIADAEWRKGFRHIFISRPECYIMAKGNKLSDQCSIDEDFYSAFRRVPHILNLLSPVYVTGTFGTKNVPQCNWNFLLSNRIQGLNPSQSTLTVDEQPAKSIDGFSVIPARVFEAEQGSTIELSFHDTRTLEVYETLRLWMLYAYKVHKGVLASSFNGYQQSNGFIQGLSKEGTGTEMSKEQYTQMHPYDRALDYCASMWDIVTNESGTRILYWCKYYGIYPVSVSPSLGNDSNAPITNLQISSTFRYQKKKEYSNANLVEFNYNAGIVDEFGVLRTDLPKAVTDALPFMVREDKNNPSMNYRGAANMFTGTPYIVLEKFGQTIAPQLRFIQDSNYQLDMGFNASVTPTSMVAGYSNETTTSTTEGSE